MRLKSTSFGQCPITSPVPREDSRMAEAVHEQKLWMWREEGKGRRVSPRALFRGQKGNI